MLTVRLILQVILAVSSSGVQATESRNFVHLTRGCMPCSEPGVWEAAHGWCHNTHLPLHKIQSPYRSPQDFRICGVTPAMHTHPTPVWPHLSCSLCSALQPPDLSERRRHVLILCMCMCLFSCLEHWIPVSQMAHSFSSSRSRLKCHLLSESFLTTLLSTITDLPNLSLTPYLHLFWLSSLHLTPTDICCMCLFITWNVNSVKAGIYVCVYSLLYLQSLEWCLACCRCLTNNYWMNKLVHVPTLF